MTAKQLAQSSAFPSSSEFVRSPGMTYREWLAGIIAAGIAAKFREAGSALVAAAAVEVADAVIAQLAEEGKP